jgi:hypothetical protein
MLSSSHLLLSLTLKLYLFILIGFHYEYLVFEVVGLILQRGHLLRLLVFIAREIGDARTLRAA